MKKLNKLIALLMVVSMVCMSGVASFADSDAGDTHVHKFKMSVTSPTCTEQGVVTQTCECGETRITYLPLANHRVNYTITKEATCTEEGLEEGDCIVCHQHFTHAIAKTGHTLGEYEVTKEATCTEAGTKTATCTACGETVTEEIPVTEHKLVTESKVDATCETAGSETLKCEDCGYTQTKEIPATGHDLKKVVVPATMDTEGSITYTCQNAGCNYEEKTVIPAGGNAQIKGSTEAYSSLADAIKDAKDGDTIVLMNDIKENVTVNKNITIDLNGKTITAETEKRIVTIAAGKNVTAQNGTISGGNGGGMTIAQGAKATLSGLTFSNNHAQNGGGLYISNAEVNMSNCDFVSNSAAYAGGGIYTTGTLTIENTNIQGNEAKTGAGINITGTGVAAACTFNSGTISDNTIPDVSGGTVGAGVYVAGSASSAEFILNGGTISGNKVLRTSSANANGGGGVAVMGAYGTFTMNGGTITQNSAYSGGGVFVQKTFNMNGGTITGNEATGEGGGVYLAYSPAAFTMNAGKLYGNTAGGGGDDVSSVQNAKLSLISVSQMGIEDPHYVDWFVDGHDDGNSTSRFNSNVNLVKKSEDTLTMENANGPTQLVVGAAYYVTFVDEDGTVLQERKLYAYDKQPLVPSNPEKADTSTEDFTFDGWVDSDDETKTVYAKGEIPAVTKEETVYVATYTSVSIPVDGEDEEQPDNNNTPSDEDSEEPNYNTGEDDVKVDNQNAAPQDTSEEDSNEDSSKPNTGDEAQGMLYLLIALGAAGTLGFVVKRRETK